MSFFSGLFLGISLIVAIGAQNIWVLNQCMAGANRLAIALACICCDTALILVGVYFAREMAETVPALLPWFTYGGAIMLLYLGGQALSRAVKGSSGLQTSNVSRQHWVVTTITAISISLLNPHVYLDTVLLLGTIGAQMPEPFLFALGACLGSVIWFGSLTAFSPRLKVLLSSPMKWRLFDTAIALILLGMAVKLVIWS